MSCPYGPPKQAILLTLCTGPPEFVMPGATFSGPSGRAGPPPGYSKEDAKQLLGDSAGGPSGSLGLADDAHASGTQRSSTAPQKRRVPPPPTK